MTLYIPGIENYTIKHLNGGMVLIPNDINQNTIPKIENKNGEFVVSYVNPNERQNNNILTEENFQKKILTGSKIIKCEIKNNEKIISKSKKYNHIICDIWKSMTIKNILINSTFNIDLEDKKGLNGYLWNEELKFSYQAKDSNGCIKEIIKMVKLNNYSLDMIIKLNDEKEVHFKL